MCESQLNAHNCSSMQLERMREEERTYDGTRVRAHDGKSSCGSLLRVAGGVNGLPAKHGRGYR